MSLKQENRPAETFRTETDSIGSKQVPMDAYYGIQTARAYENFRITGLSMHNEIINSLAQIKKACAMTRKRPRPLSVPAMKSSGDDCTISLSSSPSRAAPGHPST